MTNLENNKLIAEFMGKKNAEELQYSHTNQHGVNVYQSIHRYDTDWDWLMGVVEKIELSYKFAVTSCWEHCIITNTGENKIEFRIETDGTSKKEAVYNACVGFIKWYNINNK